MPEFTTVQPPARISHEEDFVLASGETIAGRDVCKLTVPNGRWARVVIRVIECDEPSESVAKREALAAAEALIAQAAADVAAKAAEPTVPE